MAKAKSRKGYMQPYEIAAQLAAMDKEDDIKVFGPKIVALMKDLPRDVFTTLDEKPGLFGYMDDRFYMLRQVRNDVTHGYGKQMFAGFK